MKTAVRKNLTRAYIQALGRQNYIATALAVILVTFSFLWMLFQLRGENATGVFANVMYAVASIIGALWTGFTAYRARYGPVRLAKMHQLAWLLISLGLLSDGLGGVWFTYVGTLGAIPVPSLADIGFTVLYPLVCIGLLLMPTSLRFRTRMGLDALITALCLFGMSWFFFVGPAYLMQRNTVPQAELFTSLSYPCWDIVLILALALLLQRRVEPLLRPSFFLLGAGIFADIWADTLYGYQNVFGTYNSGTFYIDPFWFIFSLLFGLAALYQYSAIARRAYNEQLHPEQMLMQTELADRHQQTPSGKRFLFFQGTLIYIPLLFLLGLMVYSEIVQNNEVSLVLVILTAIVVLLVAVRYLVATHENEVLLRERKVRHEESEQLRELTVQLTEILEFEPLLDRIVNAITTELGFDVGLLLLVDESSVHGKAARVMLRASTMNMPGVMTWEVQGERMGYCSLLLGKEMEVSWDEHRAMLPVEVQSWLEERQVATTLFVPLRYQERTLGSLGFARCQNRVLSQHEVENARAFTGQVTTIIEHVRLYHQAREHEMFAQAMANIAARLNAAVVEPTEIHQLICVEGASALQADYALLYQLDEHGYLQPVAANDTDREGILAEWPRIAPDEQEAEALNSLQPLLRNYGHSYQLEQKASSLSTVPLPRVVVGTTDARLPAVLPRRASGQLSMPLRLKLTRKFVQTAIFAPLIVGGDAIGILVFGRAVPPGVVGKKSFDITDLLRAQDFAEQASVAFANAELYRQLREAHHRLQELDQLKDQFIITASHELRTPLTSVQGYIELIAQYDEMLPPEQRQEFLQKARRSCEELVVLLSNVMDTSRLEIEAGIRPALSEPVSVLDALRNILELIEPQVTQEQREVFLTVPPGLFINTDPGRLRQILLNISSNALKYSPAGTPLAFRASPVMDGVPSVVISISDRGNGISQDDQARLFERFVRLERDINSPVRGSGLGLYITRRLVEALGGKIWIESSGLSGEGSTFHIQLPVS